MACGADGDAQRCWSHFTVRSLHSKCKKPLTSQCAQDDGALKTTPFSKYSIGSILHPKLRMLQIRSVKPRYEKCTGVLLGHSVQVSSKMRAGRRPEEKCSPSASPSARNGAMSALSKNLSGPCRTMIRPCGQRPRASCLSSYPSQRRCDKRVRSTRCSRASTIHQTTTTSKVDVKSLGLVRPSGQLWPPPRRQASRLLRTMPRRSQAQL